ncbi:MAG: DUF512 domain-containing protein [Anaerolineae bacterium]|nr:DUF512 domain-containing protein [Anaerolineae bacterium]
MSPGSPAHQLGLQPGDVLLAVDGRSLRDVLDFRFYTAADEFTLLVERAGQHLLLEVALGSGEPFGVEFESALFDGLRTCRNRCPFCFVRQMPPGFRPSLYVRDDDYRYSFLYGNFVTLTNLEQDDWSRLAEQRLSPLYVSVHATDQSVRDRLLGVRESIPLMDKLLWLRSHRIAFHAQVVLVPGLNDGPHLDRTLGDLLQLGESCLSVSVVPVGLTGRAPSHLYPFTPAEVEPVIAQVRQWRRRYAARLGRRTVYASDEWFLMGGIDLPGAPYYESFPQAENGVGAVRLFVDTWEADRRALATCPPPEGTRLVVCGTLIEPLWQSIAGQMRAMGADVQVTAVVNETLGPTVTVSGLLTGQDLVAALGRVPAGTTVCLPRAMFNQECALTLDGMTLHQIQDALGAPALIGAEAGDVLAPYQPEAANNDDNNSARSSGVIGRG